jgi:hypothetical protein
MVELAKETQNRFRKGVNWVILGPDWPISLITHIRSLPTLDGGRSTASSVSRGVLRSEALQNTI